MHLFINIAYQPDKNKRQSIEPSECESYSLSLSGEFKAVLLQLLVTSQFLQMTTTLALAISGQVPIDQILEILTFSHYIFLL